MYQELRRVLHNSSGGVFIVVQPLPFLAMLVVHYKRGPGRMALGPELFDPHPLEDVTNSALHSNSDKLL